MSGGNGTKYVTLADDKATHLLGEGEATVCGLPIPINAGAAWSYANEGKVCKDCTKAEAKK